MLHHHHQLLTHAILLSCNKPTTDTHNTQQDPWRTPNKELLAPYTHNQLAKAGTNSRECKSSAVAVKTTHPH